MLTLARNDDLIYLFLNGLRYNFTTPDKSNSRCYGPGKWDYNKGTAVVEHRGPTEQLFENLRPCPRGSTIADAYDLEDKGLQHEKALRYYLFPASLAQVLKCRRDLAAAVESAVSQVCSGFVFHDDY